MSRAERPQRDLPSAEPVRALDVGLNAGGVLVGLRERAKVEQRYRREKVIGGVVSPAVINGETMTSSFLGGSLESVSPVHRGANLEAPVVIGEGDRVDRRDMLKIMGATAAVPLAELVNSIGAAPVPRVLGMDHVQVILDSDKFITDWQHLHGGNVARHAAVAQLRNSAELLNCAAGPRVKTELFSALCRFAHTTAFMAFDACAHDDARRTFRFALSCAEEAGDWHLRAAVLSDMARQEFALGDYENSLTRVELALVRSDRLVATERAMLSALRAHALARLGRTAEAVSAIDVADREFADSDFPTNPPAISYYDVAEHAATVGQVFIGLASHGRFVAEAQDRLSIAMDGYGQAYARSRTLAQIDFALVAMKAGDPSQAVSVGIDAVAGASTIKSSRLTEGLRGLVHAGAGHESIPEVADFRHHVGAVVKSRDLVDKA